jgi:trans-aconitate 2-methyltransferase
LPRDWDAATYDRIADPQLRWGTAVLDRLELDDDGTVMDAGCGSGRVTELVAERFPNARIVALDGSSSMIEQARGRLERFGDRVTFVLADLMRPLPVDEPVDAVFSTATFHWVPDHDALFVNLAAVMRPGGRLVAQCGGAGNLTSVVRVLEDLGADTFTGKVFATPEETEARLRAPGSPTSSAGFTASPRRSRAWTRSRRSCERSCSATTCTGWETTRRRLSPTRWRPGFRGSNSTTCGSTSARLAPGSAA